MHLKGPYSFTELRNCNIKKQMQTIVCMACFFCCIISLWPTRSYAQDTTSVEKFNIEQSWTASLIKDTNAFPKKLFVFSETDSLSPAQVKKRVKYMAIGQASVYAAFMAGLYTTWYKDYPQSGFHFFNDNAEWKGMDKLGHVYSAYAQSLASMELWRWTGIERKKRIWYGGLGGAAFQTIIETLDGFSSEWGWSWADFGANVAGSALVISQELAWDEQRVQFKWSFHRRSYPQGELADRANDIYGKSTPERILKDYNAQTYWLSTTLKPFFPQSNLPAWLQLSVGTGVEGLYGARSNIANNRQGVTTFYHPEIKRYRQWYLAPDIDLTKIRTNKKAIKIALGVLNIMKFPTPSLEYGNGKFKMNWLHF